MVPLSAWANFYIIIGSSSGALTGLLFVVITLIAGRQGEETRWGLGTFTTPTVVHFAFVLLVTAILSAPWPGLAPVTLLLGLASLSGLAYAGIVVWRLRRWVAFSYHPEWDDWLWFAVLPMVVYTALFVEAVLLSNYPEPALFGIAAVLLLLLFVGIRNAWDVVTYIAVENFTQQNEQDKQDSSDEHPE
jgi:hypothetical protein